jgi:hypothetical protein
MIKKHIIEAKYHNSVIPDHFLRSEGPSPHHGHPLLYQSKHADSSG